jgi:uncharacterized membrane protein YfcA
LPPHATNFELALLFLAAAAGGALNSVVGGGSLVAFPALVLAGTPPVTANATAAFALWPGALASTVAYRRDIRPPRALAIAFIATSLVGGLAGARLLLSTPERFFGHLVPWLLLAASAAFTVGPQVIARLRPAGDGAIGPLALATGALVQLGIAVYGGYFGGGMGILMLATWSLMGMRGIHAMNGLRTLLGTVINGVAVATFLAAHAVAWRPALVMVVGATAAGYAGAAGARRVDPRWVRRLVLVMAWAMTAWFFVREVAR